MNVKLATPFYASLVQDLQDDLWEPLEADLAMIGLLLQRTISQLYRIELTLNLYVGSTKSEIEIESQPTAQKKTKRIS